MSLREELKNRLPRKCAQCGNIILPGWNIWTMGENVYCSKSCAMEAAGMEHHHCCLFPHYLDYFPKKSEDLFARRDGEVGE